MRLTDRLPYQAIVDPSVYTYSLERDPSWRAM